MKSSAYEEVATSLAKSSLVVSNAQLPPSIASFLTSLHDNLGISTYFDDECCDDHKVALNTPNIICHPVVLADGDMFGRLKFRKDSGRALDGRDLKTAVMVVDMMSKYLNTLLLSYAGAQGYNTNTMASVTDLIKNEAFEIALQPIVDIQIKSIIGYEALTRVRSGMYCGPEAWFANADICGLKDQLEHVTMRAALRLLPKLKPHQFLSLNVSPETAVRGGLAEILEGVPLDRIVLELTEHHVVGEYSALVAALKPFRKAGARIAIDDAGAGYASFRHILELNPDIVKIDRSITSGVDDSVQHRALISAMALFARETGCRIIAEGVETINESNVLAKARVAQQQGYYLGRPTIVTESCSVRD